MTTATSNGSVNSMHDSLNPIAGLVPMSHDDAQRRLQRHRRRIREHADVHHRRRVHRRADGRPDARVPRQEGRGQGGQAGDARDADPPAADLRRHGAVRGDRPGAADRRPTPARTASARSSTSSPRPRPTTARASRGWPTTTRPGTSPRASSCCSGRFPALVLPLAIAGFLAAKKRVPADDRHAADRQPDVRRACCWGRCSWSAPCRSCRPLVLGPVADHLTAIDSR